MECEVCGETENVKPHYYYDGSDPETLCWDHRKEMVKARSDQRGDYDREEPERPEGDYQSGLADY